MKKANFLSILAGLSLVPVMGLADGGSDRGGGHAYVCFQSKQDRQKVAQVLANNYQTKSKDDPFEGIDISTLRVDLLDVLQAKRQGGEDSLIPVKGSVDEIIQERINLLKSKSSFGETLENLLKGDMAKDNWVKAEGVTAVDDSADPFLISGNCLLVQLAIQDDYSVYYDSRLRQRLDVIDDVGLILHETVYRYARGLGHTTSLSTRYFVSKLLSKNFANMSASDVNYLLLKLNLIDRSVYFPEEVKVNDSLTIQIAKIMSKYGADDAKMLWQDTEVYGVPFKGRNSTFKYAGERGEFSGVLSKDFLDPRVHTLFVKGTDVDVLKETGSNQAFVTRAAVKQATLVPPGLLCLGMNFYKDGKLENCYLSGDQDIQGLPLLGNYRVDMFPDGKVSYGILRQDVEINGIKFAGNSSGREVYFHSNGKIKMATMAEDHTFLCRKTDFWGNFRKSEYHRGDTVILDEEGFASSCR